MKRFKLGREWVGPVILLGSWYLLKQFGIVKDVFLPPLGKTGLALVKIWAENGALHLSMTLYRSLVSTLMASLIAIPLGLLLGYFSSLYRRWEVVIDFFRSVPATAFFPLFILAFGIGDPSIIALATFVSSWVVLVNSIYGVWNCHKTRIKVAKAYGANELFLFTRIIVFDALPQIAVGIKLALSLSLVIVIVAEMLMGTQYGLGRIIYESYATYQTARLYAGIFLIGMVGYGVNKMAIVIEKRMIHWRGR